MDRDNGPFSWASKVFGAIGTHALLFLASSLLLLATNVATVMSASFHDTLYNGARRILLLAGEATAKRLMRHSKVAETEHRVRRDTAALKGEKSRLDDELFRSKARETAASTELTELRGRNASLDKELTTTRAKVEKLDTELTGERTKTKELAGQLDASKRTRSLEAKSAKGIAGRVRQRLAIGVSRNVGSIPAEAIPYVGIAVVLSVTAWDLYDACQTMEDINGLLIRLGEGAEDTDFCATKIPTKESVIAQNKDTWKKSLEFASNEARTLDSSVPVPQVRLPSLNEVRSVACPLIDLPGC